jgi:hypothetical protein
MREGGEGQARRAALCPSFPSCRRSTSAPGVKKVFVAKPARIPWPGRSRPSVRPPRMARRPRPRPSKEQRAAKIELKIVKPEEPKKAKVILPQTSDENYEFPPLKLLKEQAKPAGGNSDEEHRTTRRPCCGSSGSSASR